MLYAFLFSSDDDKLIRGEEMVIISSEGNKSHFPIFDGKTITIDVLIHSIRIFYLLSVLSEFRINKAWA